MKIISILLDDDGEIISDGTVSAQIYEPSGSAILEEEIDLEYDEDSEYYVATWDIPEDASVGIYSVRSTAIHDDEKNVILKEGFFVE